MEFFFGLVTGILCPIIAPWIQDALKEKKEYWNQSVYVRQAEELAYRSWRYKQVSQESERRNRAK